MKYKIYYLLNATETKIRKYFGMYLSYTISNGDRITEGECIIYNINEI